VPTAAPVHRHIGYRTTAQRKADIDKRRGSSTQRGYDRAWQKLRLEYLAQHPFCECDEHKGQDERVLSTVVDHIQSVDDRPELRLEWSNLRSMTKPCHDRRTARDQAFR